MTSMSQPIDATFDESLALRRTAIVGVYAFGFLAQWSTAGGQLSQLVLLMVTIWFTSRHVRWLVREPLAWITLFFIVYLLIRGWAGAMARPDFAADHWNGVREFFRSMPLSVFLVAVGLVATGNWKRHAIGMFAMVPLGTAIALGRSWPPERVWDALFTAEGYVGSIRYSFDRGMAEVALALTALLILTVAFTPVLALKARSRRSLCMWLAGGLIVFTIGFLALFITQVRTCWIGGSVALLVMTIALLIRRREQLKRHSRRTAGAALGIILVLGGSGIVFGDRMAARMADVSDTLVTVPQLLVGRNIETIEADSLGIRAGYWVFAARMFVERPLFGYGPADPRYLRNEHPAPSQIEDRTDNMHSNYSEVLLRLGLAGFVPLVVVMGMAFLSGWRLTALPGLTGAIGLTGIGFVTLFALWSITESRINDFDIVHVYSLYAGSVLASAVAARLSGSENREAATG